MYMYMLCMYPAVTRADRPHDIPRGIFFAPKVRYGTSSIASVAFEGVRVSIGTSIDVPTTARPPLPLRIIHGIIMKRSKE